MAGRPAGVLGVSPLPRARPVPGPCCPGRPARGGARGPRGRPGRSLPRPSVRAPRGPRGDRLGPSPGRDSTVAYRPWHSWGALACRGCAQRSEAPCPEPHRGAGRAAGLPSRCPRPGLTSSPPARVPHSHRPRVRPSFLGGLDGAVDGVPGIVSPPPPQSPRLEAAFFAVGFPREGFWFCFPRLVGNSPKDPRPPKRSRVLV